jgi:hypothetical protein
MPKLEAYLQQLLFGAESQKASLILSSNRKEIYNIVLTCKAVLEEKIRLSCLSKEEMQGLVEGYVNEKKESELFLQNIGEAIVNIRQEMELSFKTLHLFAEHKIDALERLTFKRIVDDVNYERSKYKRNPKEERIGYMVEVGFKEGILDVIRDYRYEFQKKMETLLEGLVRKYEQFGAATFSATFDAKTFCEEHFSSTLMFKNTSVVISQINAVIRKFSANDAMALAQHVEALLHHEMEAIKQKLFAILTPLNESLLTHFLEVCQAPATQIEEQIKRKETVLLESLKRLDEDENAMAQTLAQLHVRQKKLEEVLVYLGMEEGK